MMESADLGNRNDLPEFRRLDRARLRRILLQSQVRPAPMIVVQEALKVPVQASFVEHNHVVQAFAAKGADDPFDIATLGERGADRTCLIPMAFT